MGKLDHIDLSPDPEVRKQTAADLLRSYYPSWSFFYRGAFADHMPKDGSYGRLFEQWRDHEGACPALTHSPVPEREFLSYGDGHEIRLIESVNGIDWGALRDERTRLREVRRLILGPELTCDPDSILGAIKSLAYGVSSVWRGQAAKVVRARYQAMSVAVRDFGEIIERYADALEKAINASVDDVQAVARFNEDSQFLAKYKAMSTSAWSASITAMEGSVATGESWHRLRSRQEPIQVTEFGPFIPARRIQQLDDYCFWYAKDVDALRTRLKICQDGVREVWTELGHVLSVVVRHDPFARLTEGVRLPDRSRGFACSPEGKIEQTLVDQTEEVEQAFRGIQDYLRGGKASAESFGEIGECVGVGSAFERTLDVLIGYANTAERYALWIGENIKASIDRQGCSDAHASAALSRLTG